MTVGWFQCTNRQIPISASAYTDCWLIIGASLTWEHSSERQVLTPLPPVMVPWSWSSSGDMVGVEMVVTAIHDTTVAFISVIIAFWATLVYMMYFISCAIYISWSKCWLCVLRLTRVAQIVTTVHTSYMLLDLLNPDCTPKTRSVWPNLHGKIPCQKVGIE